MPYDSTSPLPPPLQDGTAKPIAPWWHTVGLLGLFILTTMLTEHRAATRDLTQIARIPNYLVSIAMELVLLALVMAGIRECREFLLRAFRNRARTFAESLGIGVAVYILGFMAIAAVSLTLYFTPLSHQRNEAIILAIAPHTPLQFIVWFFVSLSAGVCEELVFRGYLLQQLTAWTQRPIVSIVIAALLFGSVHLYEGLGAILPLAALALIYGFVVRYCKGDLRGVIVAHTLQDFIVALLLLVRPHLERMQHHA
jgi:membrane protease YdiL (CAAX protease family)